VNGRRMLCRSSRSVMGIILLSRAWGLSSHMPNIEGVATARVYSRKPFSRTKTV
jgi:hypothetical protein